MEMERYNVERDEEDFVYLFYSEGPKGRIRKMVRFQRIPDFGRNVFNLAFGDWDEEFEIYGKNDRDWVPFKKGVNYKAFLIFKKIG
jgi:hypothetical protein